MGSVSICDEAGDLAHAMQIPVTTANQWISQAPVTSLLDQAEAESKRAIRTSRETREISELSLTTQHRQEAPMPPWVSPRLWGAFLASQVICCPLVEAPTETGRRMQGRQNQTNQLS